MAFAMDNVVAVHSKKASLRTIRLHAMAGDAELRSWLPDRCKKSPSGYLGGLFYLCQIGKVGVKERF